MGAYPTAGTRLAGCPAVRYTNRLLDALRLEGDPVPDGLVAAVIARGETSAVNGGLRRLERNDQVVPAELPDDLEDWLRTSGRLPPDVDRARLDRAAELFREHGLQMALILSTASLIWCYAATKGVKALMFSSRMRHDLYHRAAETSQFVLLVLAPGGLEEGGGGIRAIQKVRLLHSSLRDLIANSGRWPTDELGVPLCQEDMLLALLTFSHDVVAGLHRLGVDLDPQDAEDYCYAWWVIGELLGIPRAIIPTSIAEAAQLRALIARRQFGPSPEGAMLTKALIEMHDRVMPGEAFDGLLPAVIRLLVGKQVADWMAVPRGPWDHLIRHYGTIGRTLEFFDRSLGSVGDLVDELAYRSLTRMAIEATDTSARASRSRASSAAPGPAGVASRSRPRPRRPIWRSGADERPGRRRACQDRGPRIGGGNPRAERVPVHQPLAPPRAARRRGRGHR